MQYAKSHWPELTIALVQTVIGCYLIGHGAHLKVVLSDAVMHGPGIWMG